MMQNKLTLWKHIKSHKSGLLSLGFLLVFGVISIFAFLWVPDRSNDANRQMAQISLKSPMFKTGLLLIPNNRDVTSNFLQELFFGKKDVFIYQAFREIEISDSLISLIDQYGVTKSINFKNWSPLVDSKYIKENHIVYQRFWLGTDKFGRDILSRLILGVRISLLIGFMSVVISLLIGITLGAIGAFFGGWVDQVVMYLINVMWSIPTLLLVFAIVLAFGSGIGVLFLAVGLTLWVDVARLVRGLVLKLKSEEYVTAAKSIAYSGKRIIIKHILPNAIGPILVIASTNFAIAILIEAGLSYLGFGIQPPSPSLGNLLSENYGYAISGKLFLAFVPAFTIMCLVLAFNIFGNSLRDYFSQK